MGRVVLVLGFAAVYAAAIAGCHSDRDSGAASVAPSTTNRIETTTSARSPETTTSVEAPPPLAAPSDPLLLAIGPSETPAGGRVLVKGIGFCPMAVVTLGYEPEEGRPDLTKVGSATADEVGAFDAEIQVPSSLAPGTYRIQALDSSTATADRPAPACTDHTAAALFTVTAQP
jgi:hypothetical protein